MAVLIPTKTKNEEWHPPKGLSTGNIPFFVKGIFLQQPNVTDDALSTFGGATNLVEVHK